MLAVGYTACEFSNEVMVQSFADLVEFSLFNRVKLAVLGSGTSALANLLGRQKGFFSGRSLEDAADIAIAKKLCSIDLNIYHKLWIILREGQSGIHLILYHLCF